MPLTHRNSHHNFFHWYLYNIASVKAIIQPEQKFKSSLKHSLWESYCSIVFIRYKHLSCRKARYFVAQSVRDYDCSLFICRERNRSENNKDLRLQLGVTLEICWSWLDFESVKTMLKILILISLGISFVYGEFRSFSSISIIFIALLSL